jgi:hypothetical protein
MRSDIRVKGLLRLQLSQKRFRNGALYVSAITNGSKVDAFDCRFFVEDGSILTPTRKGFRVRASELEALRKLFETKLGAIEEQTLWTGPHRKLVARRCDDEYGKGIDVRYFKMSEKYEGWEQRGIRLKDEDFLKLAGMVRETQLLNLESASLPDIFLGKSIEAATKPPSSRVGAVNVTDSARQPSWSPVGEALSLFLAEE